jgi:prophage DNA circulation protein
MNKTDAEDGAAIATLTLNAILDVTPTKGRPGADLRTAIGDFETFALELIQYDRAGPRLAEIFELARKNAISLPELSHVRLVAFNQDPSTTGGTLIRNSLVQLSLATEAHLIADTEFKSRNAAENMKELMNEAFDAMEEQAADSMDTFTYRALITLHAAVTEHLVTAQYPLPVMLTFRFAASAPTLVQAYRLYDDASRADELREENGVIHPLFALPAGRALAF